jgi:hypothetical protein
MNEQALRAKDAVLEIVSNTVDLRNMCTRTEEPARRCRVPIEKVPNSAFLLRQRKTTSHSSLRQSIRYAYEMMFSDKLHGKHKKPEIGIARRLLHGEISSVESAPNCDMWREVVMIRMCELGTETARDSAFRPREQNRRMP